jgi:cytochrome c551/c552|uniref:DUF4398 domain-containing protein n=1 Tax=Desulfobacca acetoxidans TaxID=60893 RepID=A0A7C5AM08_9BACT
MDQRFRYVLLGALLVGLMAATSAMAQTSKVACGPDHAILYKRAVKLLDTAEKKLAAKYTAEAKALVKEANSLFSILVKECGPQQKERALTEAESQQEAVNQKKSAEALNRAEMLEKSANDKLKKGQEAEARGQEDLARQYFRQAKAESEQAHTYAIQAEIFALRNQQLVFAFLGR